MRNFLLSLMAALAAGQYQPINAQAIAAPAGEVIGVGNFIHVVSNLDKSLEFYHDIIGMPYQPGANGQIPANPRPFIDTPEIVNLYNAIGGQYRVGTTLVPENPMRAELIEWKSVDRKPVQPRYEDPGAATMIFTVRDLAPVLARIKMAGVPIITSGGAPVDLDDSTRAILVKDPDGFFVELIQRTTAPATKAPADSNLIDVGFAFTVSDTDEMVRVFRDALGFDFPASSYRNDFEHLKLMGLHAGQFRSTKAFVPGSTFEVQFLEFKGTGRKPVHSRPQDPGSAVFRLRVRDVDTIVKALNASGVKVASANATPVTFVGGNGGQRIAIASAPDNLFVQAIAPVPAK